MSLDAAYHTLYSAVLVALLVMIGICVIRSVIGPRFTDRILSVNMLGTMVISCIAILSLQLKEGYLADVALIYAMISFIAVLMLASMFIPADAKEPILKMQKAAQAKHTKQKTSEQKQPIPSERDVSDQGETIQEKEATP